MAIIIMANGEESELNSLSLDTLKQAVGGELGVVSLPDKGRLLVNEAGARLGLPVNAKASVLFGQRVFGDAVLLNKVEKETLGLATPA